MLGLPSLSSSGILVSVWLVLFSAISWRNWKTYNAVHDVVRKFDESHDGSLNAEEFHKAVLHMFHGDAETHTKELYQALDTNEDGVCDAVELSSVVQLLENVPAMKPFKHNLHRLALSKSSLFVDAMVLVLCAAAFWLVHGSLGGAKNLEKLDYIDDQITQQQEHLDELRQQTDGEDGSASTMNKLRAGEERLEELEHEREAVQRLSSNHAAKLALFFVGLRQLLRKFSSGMALRVSSSWGGGRFGLATQGFLVSNGLLFGGSANGIVYRIDYPELDKLDKLGDGMDGAYRCYNVSDPNLKYAAKLYNHTRGSRAKEHENTVRRELRMLQMQRKPGGAHANIVQYIDVLETHSMAIVIMELVDRGQDIYTMATERLGHHRSHHTFPKPLSEASAKQIFKQLTSAILHLHRADVIHCDLKPQNVMVNGQGVVKLIDFGTVCFPDDPFKKDCVVNGDLDPPEIEMLKETGPSKMDDMWRCGGTLFFMLTGTLPRARSPFDVCLEFYLSNPDRTVSRRDIERCKNWSDEVRHLLAGLLCHEVAQRFDVEGVWSHQWLAEAELVETRGEQPAQAT